MRRLPAIRVMGIDPGLSFTGYGVVEADGEGRLRHVASGTIATSSRAAFVDRLSRIHRELQEAFHRLKPDHLALEEVFFSRHPKSALLLGHARGVAILSASLAGIPVFEYAATEAKKAVCTYGRAGKEQVGAMVKALLRVEGEFSDHASDALALCICHMHVYGTESSRAGSLHAAAGRRGTAARPPYSTRAAGRTKRSGP
jgi:crossover junction endodeoxyribonuclease RuvC